MSRHMELSNILELIDSLVCADEEVRPVYYFSHHSLTKLAVDYFKETDVIVVDSMDGKKYQKGLLLCDDKRNF